MMPKFSIKDLLIATGLISLGLVLGQYFPIGYVQHALFHASDGSLQDVSEAVHLCWPIAGALIGAGLLFPFKRPGLGVLLGLASQVPLFVVMYYFKTL